MSTIAHDIDGTEFIYAGQKFYAYGNMRVVPSRTSPDFYVKISYVEDEDGNKYRDFKDLFDSAERAAIDQYLYGEENNVYA